jgi:predicted HAD superfamily Cof-like phosphohydrolase
VSLGLPVDAVFHQIHRANMGKVWPDGTVQRDEGGKVIKPPEWQAADISGLMGLYEGTADEVH